MTVSLPLVMVRAPVRALYELFAFAVTVSVAEPVPDVGVTVK